jgi:hypothetical protein
MPPRSPRRPKTDGSQSRRTPWPAEAASPSNTAPRIKTSPWHRVSRSPRHRASTDVAEQTPRGWVSQPCPGSRHPRALHDAAVPGRSGRSYPGSRWNCRHFARAASCGPLNTTRRLWFALPPRRSTRPWLGFAPRPMVSQFSSTSFWPAGRQEKRFGVPGHRSRLLLDRCSDRLQHGHHRGELTHPGGNAGLGPRGQRDALPRSLWRTERDLSFSGCRYPERIRSNYCCRARSSPTVPP